MEQVMSKSKCFMEGMTKTIGDNQGRIGFLESVNKQLEGTVQVKHQQTEEVRIFFSFFLLDEVVFSIGKYWYIGKSLLKHLKSVRFLLSNQETVRTLVSTLFSLIFASIKFRGFRDVAKKRENKYDIFVKC